mgnify:CR=1 FL=1
MNTLLKAVAPIFLIIAMMSTSFAYSGGLLIKKKKLKQKKIVLKLKLKKLNQKLFFTKQKKKNLKIKVFSKHIKFVPLMNGSIVAINMFTLEKVGVVGFSKQGDAVFLNKKIFKIGGPFLTGHQLRTVKKYWRFNRKIKNHIKLIVLPRLSRKIIHLENKKIKLMGQLRFVNRNLRKVNKQIKKKRQLSMMHFQ